MSYYAKLTLAICAVVIQRFEEGKGATQTLMLSKDYNLPSRVVSLICGKLVEGGILSVVEIDSRRQIKGYQPALDPSSITVKTVYERLDNIGSKEFIRSFHEHFPGVDQACLEINKQEQEITENLLIKNLKIVHYA